MAVCHIPARVAALGGAQLFDLDGATVVAVVAVVRGQAVPPLRLALFFGCDLSVDFGGHLRSGLGDQSAFCHPGCLLGRCDAGYKLIHLLGEGQAHRLLASGTRSSCRVVGVAGGLWSWTRLV